MDLRPFLIWSLAVFVPAAFAEAAHTKTAADPKRSQAQKELAAAEKAAIAKVQSDASLGGEAKQAEIGDIRKDFRARHKALEKQGRLAQQPPSAAEPQDRRDDGGRASITPKQRKALEAKHVEALTALSTDEATAISRVKAENSLTGVKQAEALARVQRHFQVRRAETDARFQIEQQGKDPGLLLSH